MLSPLFTRARAEIWRTSQVAQAHQRAETAFLLALAGLLIFLAICAPPAKAPAPAEPAPSHFTYQDSDYST